MTSVLLLDSIAQCSEDEDQDVNKLEDLSNKCDDMF